MTVKDGAKAVIVLRHLIVNRVARATGREEVAYIVKEQVHIYGSHWSERYGLGWPLRWAHIEHELDEELIRDAHVVVNMR